MTEGVLVIVAGVGGLIGMSLGGYVLWRMYRDSQKRAPARPKLHSSRA